MRFTNKKFLTLAFILLIIGLIFLLWFFLLKNQSSDIQITPIHQSSSTSPQDITFTPSFTPLENASSSGFIFSNPDQTLPSTAKGDTRKVKLFHLEESSSGFSPSTLVIHKTDTVRLQFTAVDGDYDLAIAPPIGAYIAAAKGGSTLFGFDARFVSPGIYTFMCQRLCPPQHPQGTLVIQ